MLARKPSLATWLKLGMQVPVLLVPDWCSAVDVAINSTQPQDQEQQSVAQLNDGTLVFVWEDESVPDSRIMLRRFNTSLAPIGAEQQVNVATGSSCAGPVIASVEGGGFVVAYSSSNLDPDNNGVAFRRYDASAIPLDANEVLANTFTATSQFRPQIAPLLGGGFVLAWVGQGGALGQDVFYRRFDANGVALDAADVRANNLGNDAVIAGDQGSQKLAVLADGGFVLVYEDRASDNLFGVRVGSDGSALDAPGELAGNKQFQISLATPFVQTMPCAAALANGGFVVTYNTETNGTAAARRVFGRVFSSSGIGGAEFQIGNHTSRWQDSRVIALRNSDFVVTWQASGEAEDAGSGTWSVWSQRFDPAGVPRAGPFRVNTFNVGDQDQPSLAAFHRSGYVITWKSFGQDASRFGVFARAFIPGPGLLTLQISAPGVATVSGVGEPGWVHGLQRSGDFVSWTPVIATNPASGVFQFSELLGTTNRFYRMESY